MRKINTRTFQLATRNTQRDVNRRIVLNLIREFQPISRAELARRMKVRRGTITTLVKELLESGAVQETGAVTAVRGRRPTMLTLATTGRYVIAADVRPGETRLALADA
ncbi:MAG TPA: MarR family transcriptional regulator, partial [Gemmatimonadaceae bacterium]